MFASVAPLYGSYARPVRPNTEDIVADPIDSFGETRRQTGLCSRS